MTPVAGAALGMYFEKVRNRIRNKAVLLGRLDRVVLGLTDPLGALNRKFRSFQESNPPSVANEQSAISIT